MTGYKKSIVESCKVIAEARNKVFTSMINLAMQGEHAEIDAVFREGDVFSFEKEQFRDCTDINLIKLYQLVDILETTYSTLLNINGLESGKIGE